MKPRGSWWVLALLVLTANSAAAQEAAIAAGAPSAEPPRQSSADRAAALPPSLNAIPSTVVLVQAAGTPAPPPASPPASPAPQPPDTDAFAQAPAAGGEAPEGSNPRMIGDFPGYFSLRQITLPSFEIISTFQNVTKFKTITTFKNEKKTIFLVDRPPTFVIVKVPTTTKVPFTTQVPVTYKLPTTVTTLVRVPFVSLGAFKIAENQGVMPEDRVFLGYNYYSDVRGPVGPIGAHTDTQQTTFNGFPATVSTAVPGAAPPQSNLNREVFGFQKTFFDGNASFGLRAPLLQTQGDGSFSMRDFGDVSLIVNYVLFANRATGNALVGGMVATLPTAGSFGTIDGNINPTILQPFLGYRWANDRLYLQGFSSVAMPTDPRVVTAMFNDVGAGYWLYRAGPDRMISALIPTLEAHVTTPLNNRSAADLVTVPNIVSLTGGAHIGLFGHSMLTLGVVVPVTGPLPFTAEGVVQFNYWF